MTLAAGCDQQHLEATCTGLGAGLYPHICDEAEAGCLSSGAACAGADVSCCPLCHAMADPAACGVGCPAGQTLSECPVGAGSTPCDFVGDCDGHRVHAYCCKP